jgi:hypothetical protein
MPRCPAGAPVWLGLAPGETPVELGAWAAWLCRLWSVAAERLPQRNDIIAAALVGFCDEQRLKRHSLVIDTVSCPPTNHAHIETRSAHYSIQSIVSDES